MQLEIDDLAFDLDGREAGARRDALATTGRRPVEPPAPIAGTDPTGLTTGEQKIEAQLAEAAVPLTAATLRKPCHLGNDPDRRARRPRRFRLRPQSYRGRLIAR